MATVDPRPLIGRDESRDEYHVTVTSYKMAAAMFWRDLVLGAATCVREFIKILQPRDCDVIQDGVFFSLVELIIRQAKL